MVAPEILLALGGSVTRAAIPALCADLSERLRGRPGGVVTCDVAGVAGATVATVEALARLRLTARRHGWRMVLAGVGPDLAGLIALLGLSAVLPEVLGQPEQREQPGGVEEVVEPRDPAA